MSNAPGSPQSRAYLEHTALDGSQQSPCSYREISARNDKYVSHCLPATIAGQSAFLTQAKPSSGPSVASNCRALHRRGGSESEVTRG